MSRRIVNLTNVCMIEREGARSSDLHFKLKFWGDTPGGKDMVMIIDLPAWGVGHLAERLWEVQKEQERHIKNNRDSMKGDDL